MLSWHKVVKALAKDGFRVAMQKGSYIILVLQNKVKKLENRFNHVANLFFQSLPKLISFISVFPRKIHVFSSKMPKTAAFIKLSKTAPRRKVLTFRYTHKRTKPANLSK